MSKDPAHGHVGAAHSSAGGVAMDLFVLEQRLHAVVKTELMTEGVAPVHFFVCSLVAAGVSTPGAIAQSLSLSPATLTGHLDMLERRGLLSRDKSPTDRRSVVVSLTEEGQRTQVACERAIRALLRRLDRALGGARARNEIRAALGALDTGLVHVEQTMGTPSPCRPRVDHQTPSGARRAGGSTPQG